MIITTDYRMDQSSNLVIWVMIMVNQDPKSYVNYLMAANPQDFCPWIYFLKVGALDNNIESSCIP